LKPVLQVKNLTVAFDKVVVKSVNFNVYPGQTTAIVGESGSGKTVTSTAVMGLLPPSGKIISGEITGVNNLNYLKNGSPVGTEISMVFQDPMSSLNPSMRVGNQVGESLRVHLGLNKYEATQKVIELFTEVELPSPKDTLNKYPHELSGGQKQRVMIAMALACEPSILVADEPTTALDVTVQAKILKLLLKLQKERKLGVLFISHDLEVIRSIAQHVTVMKFGEIVEQGSCENVLDHPTHPYTIELINSRPKKIYEDKISHPQSLIEVKNLSLEYTLSRNVWGNSTHSFKAVDNVSFIINRGERVGIVGESGCGKSTLGRLMLGIENPSKGEVIWRSEVLRVEDGKSMKKFRREAQPVFQDPYSALNPRIKIGEAICEAIRQTVEGKKMSRSQQREEAQALLVEVGLQKEDVDKFPSSCSGGMRQRIVLARALAVKPIFLILDESVAALDLRIQSQILKLLSEIQRNRSLSYMFISHDLDVIRAVCDKVLVMKDGLIIEEGSTDEVFNSPVDAYTKHLLESRPGKLNFAS
jgi:peptide/nickel transport system ATP-binding protein